MARQRSCDFPTHGGKRPGAGRKPKGKVAGMPHVARPEHPPREPVHVTLRVRPQIPNLRDPRIGGAIGELMKKRALRPDPPVRVVHFSLEPDHLHLVVEADDRRRLMYGIRGLEIQLARTITRALGWPSGHVFADRYDARACRGPTETRRLIVYVLRTFAHHIAHADPGPDPYSSGAWFDGWVGVEPRRDPAPVSAPRTWLLRAGWRERGGGPIDPREGPAEPKASRRRMGQRPTPPTAA